MLDRQSLEWLMACERLKDEVVAVEKQCESILGSFEHLQREPTAAERDNRRGAYLENRARLQELAGEIDAINTRLRARQLAPRLSAPLLRQQAVARPSPGTPRFSFLKRGNPAHAIGVPKSLHISPTTFPNRKAVQR